MSRWLSLALLLGVIVAVSIIFYQVMIGFVLPLFLAAILVVIFRPLHAWFLQRWKNRPHTAAALTTTVVVLIVIAPAVLLTMMAAVEASSLPAQLNDQKIKQKITDLRRKLKLEYEFADEVRYLELSVASLHEEAQKGATAIGEPQAYQRLVDAAEHLHNRLVAANQDLHSLPEAEKRFQALNVLAADEKKVGTLQYKEALQAAEEALAKFKLELLGGEFRAWAKEVANPTEEEISEWTGRFFAGAPGFLRFVGGATTGFLISLLVQGGIMILAMYFFLVDGPAMVENFMRLSPLDDAHERELIDEFDRISRAVVLATLLAAVVQGVLAGIGFWMVGLESVFLLSMITIVFALVPFVGAASVWVPACLWLYFYQGRAWAAILLALYGVLISTSDNFIKPLVLHGQSNLHPLLALLSVLGGVQALGPIGILVGPMIVVFLQVLLNILHRELVSLDKKKG